MKNTKKLFLSVFALSAMILSACSGGTVTPDTSSTEPAPGTSSQEPAPATSSQEPGPASSSQEPAPESSSALPPEESSSVEPEPVIPADYQVEIGNAVYDLVYNTDQTEYTEYYLGADVTKAVNAGEAISFLEYDWDHEEYDELTATPSPDNTTGLVYNNVVLDGTDYEIRASGDVAIYLKQDLDGNWTYWITGGGDMEDPFYAGYRLAYGADDDDPTWAFDNAEQGIMAKSTEAGVVKQIKFSVQFGYEVYAKVRNAIDGEGSEWYGKEILDTATSQDKYREEGTDNIHFPVGEYNIYFKLYDDNGHSIYIEETKPSSLEHLFASVNSDAASELVHTEAPDGWNQFNVENVDFAANDELYVWDDLEKTTNAFARVKFGDDKVAAYFDVDTTNQKLVVKYEGAYSLYFNETETGELTLWVTTDATIPSTKVTFNVPYDLSGRPGYSMYVVGSFTDWKAKAEYQLKNKDGNWVVDATDATKGFDLPLGHSFKLVIAKDADLSIADEDWEQDPNRTVTENLEVTSWQSAAPSPVQSTEYSFVTNVELPSGQHYFVNSWNDNGSLVSFVEGGKVDVIENATGLKVAMTTAADEDSIVWDGEGKNFDHETGQVDEFVGDCITYVYISDYYSAFIGYSVGVMTEPDAEPIILEFNEYQWVDETRYAQYNYEKNSVTKDSTIGVGQIIGEDEDVLPFENISIENADAVKDYVTQTEGVFSIKFNGTLKLYIKTRGTTALVWVDYVDDDAVALDYYVVTDADSWAKNETAKLAYDSVNNKYTISGFALAQDQKIKVIDSSDSPEWYGNASVWDNCGFTLDGDNNLVISEAGNYTIDFYLESAQNNHIVIGKEVAPATITSLAVALHESYATKFSGRTYFIYSWKGSQNHTDFFTAAGNVEVIDGADGYLFGALKSEKTEADGLGEWGNVDDSSKTSDITSFPTTNVELHYADSKATAWLDGVDPATIIPDSALFTVPSDWNADTIYVYAWSGEGDDLTKNGEWPGVQLSDPTTNGYSQTQYAITIGEYDNFIISDGTKQTVDLLASQLAGKSGCYCNGDKDSSGHYELVFW